MGLSFETEPAGEDPALIDGEFLHALDRTTAADFWKKQRDPILTQEESELAAAILFNSGADLRTLLLEAGILTHMSDEETSHIRDVVSEGNHQHGAKGNARFTELCRILQIDRCSTEREVFSLSRFRHFFVDSAHIFSRRPSGFDELLGIFEMHLPAIVSAHKM